MAVAVEAASLPAVNWNGSQAVFFSDNDGPFTLGFRFRADSDLKITALGAFDYLGDGLATTHIVGIWPTNGGAPLATVTIPSGTNAPLLGAFRYATVSNVMLSAHTEYIIGASDFYGEDADIYPYDPQGFSTAPGVTFLRARESSDELTGGLLFPDDEYNPGSPLAVNFQFVSVSRLVIQREGSTGVELSWTTNAPGFHPEYAESLASTVWNTVTNVPTVIGDNFVVPLPNTGVQRYFRLRSP